MWVRRGIGIVFGIVFLIALYIFAMRTFTATPVEGVQPDDAYNPHTIIPTDAPRVPTYTPSPTASPSPSPDAS